jgi:SOS-response transcriptional repressor LexA
MVCGNFPVMDQELTGSLLAVRIAERLEVLGISPRAASEMTGRGADVIRNIQRAASSGKPYHPRSDTIQVLASVLKTTPEWLLGYDMRAPDPGSYRPEPQLFGDRDFRIFSAVEGGPGEMVIDNEPIEVVARPWYMRDVRDGYGVVVVGESMTNRYQPGDIVIVNPKLPLLRGKAAIFVSEAPGDWRAMLKRFDGQTEKSWQVSQFNPEKRLELDRRKWNKAFRVVGTYEGI